MPRDFKRNAYYTVALPKALDDLLKEKAQRLGLDVAGYLKYLAIRDVDPGVSPIAPAQEARKETTGEAPSSLATNAKQAASAWTDDEDEE